MDACILRLLSVHADQQCGGIHVGGNTNRGKVFPDQSLCTIPVEVRGRVSNTWQVDTG